MGQKRSETSKPGTIHLRIIEVLKKYPNGVSGGQIRQELEKEGLGAGEHTHLDRRKRDLKKWFLIEKVKTTQNFNGKKRVVTLYRFAGERKVVVDQGQIDQKTKAQVIHSAHSRCQMCGHTVQEDGIKLVVDHRKPRDWGGTNELDNLWAICEECNSGKKAYFSSVTADHDTMKRIMSHASVHVRIGEMLKAVGEGIRTSSVLLAIVADQDDWNKRLRELRYPVIGWEIDTFRHKDSSGRIRVDYILRKYKEWPPDPTGMIRKFEREREESNNEG